MRPFKGWCANKAIAIVVPALAFVAIATLLVVWGPRRSEQQATGEIWTCSMHPQVRMDKPGRCPICGMTLIPLSQLAAEQSRIERQGGMETERVQRRELFKEIRTVGKLDYNERSMALITARIAGRVDRVYADFTGIHVEKGDHLVDMYSPELYSTQGELFRALEANHQVTGDRRFAAASLEAARTKLNLLGILPEQIAQLERERKQLTHLTIYAPIGGVVVEKDIREQQYVAVGDVLYRIAELDPIWLYLDIYEYDLSWVRFGQQVDLTVEAYPGEVFPGTVVFIEPFLDDKTRTVKVRVNLKNPSLRLKPAMYASATIHVRLRGDGTPEPTGLEGKFVCPMHPDVIRDSAGTCEICEMALVLVPKLLPAPQSDRETTVVESEGQADGVLALRKSAVLDTGRRQVVYRKRPDGAYELVEVKLGPLAEARESNGQIGAFYTVLAGLKLEDEVVVQGGFLLDSQRQIEGMPSLLYTEGRSAASLHAGHGGTSTSNSSAPPASAAPVDMPPSHQH